MKSKYVLSSIVCATALLSACNTDSFNPFEIENPSKVNDTTITVSEKQNDAKILGDLIALNKNEIASSQEAKKRATRFQVKEFATFAYSQHSSNLQKTLVLGHKLKLTPEMDHTAARLQHDGEQEMTQLRTLSQHDFDNVYISDMIRDHKEALNIINHDLKKVNDEMLKKHLEKTRDAVSMHLHKAEALQ
jgi:predicted outer membrane protein